MMNNSGLTPPLGKMHTSCQYFVYCIFQYISHVFLNHLKHAAAYIPKQLYVKHGKHLDSYSIKVYLYSTFPTCR